MTGVALAATEEAPHQHLDPALLVDLLWALATPEMGIQHLRAATAPGKARLIIFCTAADPHSGASAGRRLCEGVVGSAPQLRGWFVLP
ncbi:hypothetical protein ACWEVP_16990 [Amycolatopsis sp. NPDC003865]